MTQNGVGTTQIALATAIDELVGNKIVDGLNQTVRIAMQKVAEQMLADGPVKAAFGGVTGYGPSSSRPVIGAGKTGMYYDTTLGKPIFWSGSIWRDANGIDADQPMAVGNIRLAGVGDSRSVSAFVNGFRSIRGYAEWILELMGNAIDLKASRVFAGSGHSTLNVLTTHLPAALASDAGAIFLLAGTNDPTSGNVANLAASIANIDAMVALRDSVAPNKPMFICDELPRTAGLDANGIAWLAGIRDKYRSLHSPVRGLNVIPTWNAYATIPNGTDPKPGFMQDDGIHPRSKGMNSIVTSAKPVMLPRYPTFDITARPGVLAGGNFATSGGTLAGGATGTVPAGVTVSGPVASSVVAQDGLNWLKVEIAAQTAPTIQIYGSDMLSLFASGALIDFNVLYRTDADPANLRMVTACVKKQSGTILLDADGYQAIAGKDNGTSYQDPFPGNVTEKTLLLPNKAVRAADATILRWFVEPAGLTGLECSAVIYIAMPQARLG